MKHETTPTTPRSATTPTQRILVGYDVLADSTDALTQALSFATLIPGTHVEVVWVPPMAYVPGETSNTEPIHTLNRRVKETITEFGAEKLSAASIEVRSIIGEGRPAQAISRIAFMHEADMIIVGSRDKASAIEELLLGSVARKLVSIAPCPVLVMRPRSVEAVPEIEKPLEENQARRTLGRPHRYYSAGRNVQARENMPLLFPVTHL